MKSESLFHCSVKMMLSHYYPACEGKAKVVSLFLEWTDRTLLLPQFLQTGYVEDCIMLLSVLMILILHHSSRQSSDLLYGISLNLYQICITIMM